jgi:hypothetical protein
VPPWRDPKNLTLNWIVEVDRGPICAKGDTSGKSCHYVPFAGVVITVIHGGVAIRHAISGKSGFVTVKLPKGRSQVRFSHPPVGGVHYGAKTFTVDAPLFHAPGAKRDFVMNYCVGSC